MHDSETLLKKDAQLHQELQSKLDEFGTLIQKSKTNSISENDSYEESKRIVSKLVLVINEFEANPLLLELKLADYITTLSGTYLQLFTFSGEWIIFTRAVGELIYSLAKICGFKNITTYFSSDVYLIPRLLELCESVSNDNELFLCLIWLSNLVLVPFKLHEIDQTLVQQLYHVGLKNLAAHSNASKNQMVSLILLSRLITRPDIHEEMLSKYFNDIQSNWTEIGGINGSIKLGHHITIKKILKRCPLLYIQPHIDLIYDMISFDLLSLRQDEKSLNNLNILYVIKILGRLSMIHIQCSDFHRLENTINSLLVDVFGVVTSFETSLRYALAKALLLITQNLSECAVNYQEQLTLFMISQLEVANIRVPNLPYSGANGQNHFQNNLDICAPQIDISRYHTVLLYLGYVCLKKSLQQHLIPVVLSIIHKTLFVEQRRFTITVGGQVRDSSCFVMWALSRMIDLETFESLSLENPEMMPTMFLDMILVITMDSDLVIRRCGIAIAQEFLGRFGTLLFKKQFNLGELLGKFLISLVELLSNSAVSSPELSFGLIMSLVEMGFDKLLFIPVLVRNLLLQDKIPQRKLNSRYCSALLASNSVPSVTLETLVGNEQLNVSLVLQLLAEQKELLLYPIAELLAVDANPQIVEKIASRLSNEKFEFHHDSQEKAEGYMKWVNTVGKADWSNIFSVLRMHPTEELKKEFAIFFTSLGEINQEYEAKLRHYLRNNNAVLSNVIFCLRPKSIGLYIEILADPLVDAHTRTNMINNLSQNCTLLSIEHRRELLELLDDYTTTNQGDVGSKVRFATINLIDHNFQLFVDERTTLELKLIRLAGELMDKIRLAAYKLLCRLYNYQDQHYSGTNEGQEFKGLFSFYKKEILLEYDEKKETSLEFWRGVCFTIGATTANSSVVNNSFREFLLFLAKSPEQDQHNILQNLVTLLKSSAAASPRQIKGYVVVLNVFVKLFEANYRFPTTFSYEALFIRCYNLQIKTSNTNRLGLTIRVLQFLAMQPEVEQQLQLKARKRVVQLAISHRLTIVRKMCGDALFEILNELQPTNSEAMSQLDAVDWTEQKSAQRSQEVLNSIFMEI